MNFTGKKTRKKLATTEHRSHDAARRASEPISLSCSARELCGTRVHHGDTLVLLLTSLVEVAVCPCSSRLVANRLSQSFHVETQIVHKAKTRKHLRVENKKGDFDVCVRTHRVRCGCPHFPTTRGITSTTRRVLSSLSIVPFGVCSRRSPRHRDGLLAESCVLLSSTARSSFRDKHISRLDSSEIAGYQHAAHHRE